MRWTDKETQEELSLFPTTALAADLKAFWARDCIHQDLEPRWSVVSGGARQLRNQCLKCGELIGGALPQSKATKSTGGVDKSLSREYVSARNTELNAIYRSHYNQQQTDKTNFEGQHAAYLKTPEWQLKRQKVISRAGGLCEGCGERGATQVHHLTYAHWKNELLFELVAVCDECHSVCHEADNSPASGLGEG